MVFGEGNPNAIVMFVGEGPGKEEQETGRPFVGRCGKLLRDMIRAIEIPEEHHYLSQNRCQGRFFIYSEGLSRIFVIMF
jgi:DNA polymerase